MNSVISVSNSQKFYNHEYFCDIKFEVAKIIILSPQITNEYQSNYLYLNLFIFGISKAVHYIFSGLPLHFVEKWKQFDDAYHPRMTILKVALCVGSLTTGAIDVISQMPVNAYLDENIFFLIHDRNESEMMQKNVVIKDKSRMQRN